MNVLVKDINYEIKNNVDINNITYVLKDERYHIFVEFSRLPIESLHSEKQAIDFIIGYHTGVNETKEMKLGRMFRSFVENDLKSGIQYKKVLTINITKAFRGNCNEY